MLVVMQSHATPAQVDDAVRAIREMGLTPHSMPGATRTAIGITGNMSAVDPRTLEVLPGVMELIRVTKPYKLASREMRQADTVIRVGQAFQPDTAAKQGAVREDVRLESLTYPTIGPGTFTIIAGPCSVENEAMI